MVISKVLYVPLRSNYPIPITSPSPTDLVPDARVFHSVTYSIVLLLAGE